MDESKLVRCNWCMTIMNENEIPIIEDEECCVNCKKTGYLMEDFINILN